MAQSLPPIDDSQDWTVLNGEEVDGYTIIHFTRSWVTCDDRDRDVTVSLLAIVQKYELPQTTQLIFILCIPKILLPLFQLAASI